MTSTSWYRPSRNSAWRRRPSSTKPHVREQAMARRETGYGGHCARVTAGSLMWRWELSRSCTSRARRRTSFPSGTVVPLTRQRKRPTPWVPGGGPLWVLCSFRSYGCTMLEARHHPARSASVFAILVRHARECAYPATAFASSLVAGSIVHGPEGVNGPVGPRWGACVRSPRRASGRARPGSWPSPARCGPHTPPTPGASRGSG